MAWPRARRAPTSAEGYHTLRKARSSPLLARVGEFLAIRKPKRADRVPTPGQRRPDLLDMEVIVRRQNQKHCASITCMIRHYVARRAQVIEDHPHNAE